MHIARMLKVHRPFTPEVSRSDTAGTKKAPKAFKEKGEKECEEISLRYRNEKSLSMTFLFGSLLTISSVYSYQVPLNLQFGSHGVNCASRL